MTRGRPKVIGGRDARPVAPRVGLLGILGSGNLGNEASLSAILDYLHDEQPSAVLEAMTTGPDRVTSLFGIPARHLHWHHRPPDPTGKGRLVNLSRVGMGMLLDAPLTLAWVRRQDIVIVPGSGVMEATLPVRPWQLPYSLFLLVAGGRIFGTRVAFVSVGADIIPGHLTRWLLVTAARHAAYRSWRDSHSKAAMAAMGVDVSRDEIYPDLAFTLPTPPTSDGAGPTVGIGLIDYEPRRRTDPGAEMEQSDYVTSMSRVVERLLEKGHHVALFGGDEADRTVVERVRRESIASRPDLSHLLVDESAATWAELVRIIARKKVVVASRFHNVVFSLLMAKPTLSLGYAAKSSRLMTEMGLSEFAKSIEGIDAELVVEDVERLLGRGDALGPSLAEAAARTRSRAVSQFDVLNRHLFSN